MQQHSNFADTARAIGDSLVSFDNYHDEIMVLHFRQPPASGNGGQRALQNPMKHDALLFVGIDEGEMEIQIDYTACKAQENTLCMVLPEQFLQIESVSGNLKGWAFAISNSMLRNVFNASKNAPSIINYMQLKKNPTIDFDPDEYSAICSGLDFVTQKIRMQRHIFHSDIIALALRMFLLDMSNIYSGKRGGIAKPTLSRKEEIFVDFHMLLREHCKNQHEVTFYANKLCITTQYLTAVLKEQSGKTASQLIHEALMVEAKVLLKMPRSNVQQVAYELNFPDQSSFSKFFKKHEGIPPTKFRKSN